MKQVFGWVLGLIFLASCGSTPPTESTAAIDKVQPPIAVAFNQVSLVLSGPRELELEPCGCELGTMGGVGREFNMLAKWRSRIATQHVYYFTGGKTFVSGKRDEDRSHSFHKAKYLVRAMNELGVSAVAPSAEDLIHGPEKLNELQQLAKFSFVGTNLVVKGTKQPVFKPYLTYVSAPHTVTLLSVVAKPSRALAGYLVLPPEQAITKTLKDLKEPGLVVLITNLPERQRQALMKKFPAIRVVFDVSGAPAAQEVSIVDRRWVDARPSGRGRELLRLDFDMNLAAPELFNRELSDVYTSAIYAKQAEKHDLEAQLAASVIPETQQTLRKNLAVVKRWLARAETSRLPEPTPATMSFEYEMASITAQWDQPSNAVFDLVGSYKLAAPSGLP